MRLFSTVFLLFITTLIVLLLSGCKSTDWADECQKRFPFRTDSTRVRIVTTRIDTVMLSKSIVNVVDTTICPPMRPKSDTIIKNIQVDCPQKEVIVKTIEKIDSIVLRVADTRKEEQLNQQIKAKESQLAAEIRQTNRLTWLSVFLGIGLVVLIVLLRLRK